MKKLTFSILFSTLFLTQASHSAQPTQTNPTPSQQIYLLCGGGSGGVVIGAQAGLCYNLTTNQVHVLGGPSVGLILGLSAHGSLVIFRGDASSGIGGTYCGGRFEVAVAQYGLNARVYKRLGKKGYLFGVGWSGGANQALGGDCIVIN